MCSSLSFTFVEMLYQRLCIGNTGRSCPIVLHSSKAQCICKIIGTRYNPHFIPCWVWSKTRQSRKTVENFRTSRILMMLEYCLLSEVRLYSMEPGRMGISWLRQGSGWVERSDGVWGVISLCMLLKVNMAHKQEWPESVGRIRNHSPTWMCFSMP